MINGIDALTIVVVSVLLMYLLEAFIPKKGGDK